MTKPPAALLSLLFLLQQLSWVTTVSGTLSCGPGQDGDELLKTIGDQAVLTASSFEPGFDAEQVRLEGRAWCTRSYVQPGFDKPTNEWLQIDYGSLYYFRGVLTRGRLLSTNEFVERYRIEFKRKANETWKVYKLYNGAEVMKGNDDSSGIELTALDPPLLARFVRIVPLQPPDSQAKKVCLHLGFYGCRDKSGYVSYSAPPGERLGDALLDDTRYDGAFSNGTWVSGLGLLMDGQLETGSNPQQPDQRNLLRSVAWHNNGQPVKLLFEFDHVRNFSSAIIHTSNEPKLDVRTPAFVKLEFSVGGLWYQKSVDIRPVRSDTAHPESIRVDLTAGGIGTFGRYVRMTMLFASQWIAVSEVHFESTPMPDSAVATETTVTTTTSTTPSTTTSTTTIKTTEKTTARVIVSGKKNNKDAKGGKGQKTGKGKSTTLTSIIDEELSSRLKEAAHSDDSAEAVDILAIDAESSAENAVVPDQQVASVTSKPPGSTMELRPLSEEFIAIVVGSVLAVTLSIFVVILACVIRRRRIKRRRNRGISLESGGHKRPSAAFVYRPCALGPRGNGLDGLRSVLHDDDVNCMLGNGSSGSAASTSAGPGSASPPHSTGGPDVLSANSAEKCPYGSRQQLLVNVNSDWTTTATSLAGLPIQPCGFASPPSALAFGVTVSPPHEQLMINANGNIVRGTLPTIRAPLPPSVVSPASIPPRPYQLQVQSQQQSSAPAMGTLGRWISPAAGRRWGDVRTNGTNVASPRTCGRPSLLATNTSARLSAYDLSARAGAFGMGPCGNTLPFISGLPSSNGMNMDDPTAQLLSEVEERFVAEIDPESLQLVETLGRGAFGEITICEIRTAPNNSESVSSALVLVKRLFSSATDQARDQFVSETRLLTILNHPNISLVVGQSLSANILIHELPKLGDMVDLLGDHSAYLSLSCRLHLASQLASALRYMDTVAHMCHGDIGSRNCFVGVGLVLKLSDTASARTRFARLYSNSRSRPVAVRWAAPEVLLAGEYSAKSDVWSFAVALWELLAWGTVTYSPSPTEVLLPLPHLNDAAVSSIICQLSNDETYLPRVPTPFCPAELANLMEECWRADPNRRPSMSEVSMVLQRRVIGYNPDAEYRQLVLAATNGGGTLSSPETSTP